MNNKTIIYVNFSPYENTGRMLDYLLRHFSIVIAFCFNFHALGKTQEPSRIVVYKNARRIQTIQLWQTPDSRELAFLLLPIRSFIILLQIVVWCSVLRNTYGPYDLYFTTNAFTAWVGMILKKIRFVRHTIFWVWDYYPPIHKNAIVMLMRRIYWYFDKIATDGNHLVFLNKRLMILRQKIGILPRRTHFPIVGIGTVPTGGKKTTPAIPTLLFIGVLKKSQGLDILFRDERALLRAFPNIEVHVIGAGPDEEYFKQKAAHSRIPIFFYGNMEIYSQKAKHIIRKCSIGFAPYEPQRGNVAYYADPAKIKNYLSYGLPVITTNIFTFSKEIKHEKAGIIIDYYSKNATTRAIQTVLQHYSTYQKNARALALKYRYTRIYPRIFAHLLNQAP